MEQNHHQTEKPGSGLNVVATSKMGTTPFGSSGCQSACAGGPQETPAWVLPLLLSVIVTAAVILAIVLVFWIRVYLKKRLSRLYGNIPINLTLGDSDDVICGVQLQNIHSRKIRLKWTSGYGNAPKLDSIEEYRQNECRVPGHLFNHPGFKACANWIHESMDGPETREISASDLPWKPQLSDIIRPEWENGTDAHLQCKISGFFPNNLEVNWFRKEQGDNEFFHVCPGERYTIPKLSVEKQKDGTYTCTASLQMNVSAALDEGIEFLCQVVHPTLEKPDVRQTGKLLVKGTPFVTVSYIDGCLTRHLRASIKGFFPTTVKVTWSKATRKGYKKCPMFDISNCRTDNSDASSSLISLCKDRTSRSACKKTFKLTVKHETLESPIEMIISRERGVYYLKSETGKIAVPEYRLTNRKQEVIKKLKAERKKEGLDAFRN